MRAGAVAAGFVVLASVGSLGFVFAQKGGLPAMPWIKSGTEASSTVGGAVPDPSRTSRDARGALSPIAEQPMTVAQASPPARVSAAPSPQPSAASALPPLAPAAVVKGPPCTNPNALGVSRVVEIDTTGGPGFGFEHFKQHDFLRNGEVVLTFDDGPWLGRTPLVLKALADQCVKATFFIIGKHATYYPEILKQVHEAGHSVGSHTWSHQDLSKKSVDEAKEEIEKGVSAVKAAIGQPITAFFRFPALRHPPEVVAYLGERNVGIFSTDLDSFDFKVRKPEKIVQTVMDKLKKYGKGIVLLHDFQDATSKAVPQLLAELKANGYKIVYMTSKMSQQSLAQYDELLAKDQKLPTIGGGRPTTSVVKTIAE